MTVLLFLDAHAGVTIVDLGMVGSATRLNNSGQVIGYDSTPWNGSYQSFQSWIWQNGTFTDLGTVQRTTYLAVSLNNSGQVVGTLNGQAFLWENGVMTDLGASLGSSVATGINDSGQVIGSFYDGSFWHAYIWQNGAMTPLGTLGGRSSSASGINKYGQIVGSSELSDGSTFHAFLWQNGVMTDLGGLPGSPYCYATFINDSGQVIGQAGPGYPYSHGFLWENGVMKDLSSLGGSLSELFGMNNAGQVVGYSYLAGDVGYHAALWQNGTITDLGSSLMPSWAYGGHVGGAINNAGVIVGTLYDYYSNGAGAFIWRNGLLTDLNTQLPVGSGWNLTSAEYINDAGQIVGTGTLNGEGGHTFLLTLDQIPPFVVTTTADTVADDGVISLREALLYANTLTGPNSILFNIPTTDPNYNPASGIFTIAPTSPLPVITRTVTIDGTTQPGFDSTIHRPVIELNGSNAGAAVGLNISAGNCTVRGLVINRFSDAGIFLQAGGGNDIEGNFVGTDATGNLALGNGSSGVGISSGSSGNVIGGTTATSRNIISGNGEGVQILGGSNNIVEGNYIGVNAAGTAPIPNTNWGVQIDLDGSGNVIGGTGAGLGNVIAFNGSTGVQVASGVDNAIRGNSIFFNLGLGISLGVGANNQQNRPVFAGVRQANGFMGAAGGLFSSPNATFAIDFYGNTQADPSGYGQGQVYLCSLAVTTDGAGNAPFSLILPLPAGGLQFLTATATDAAGNTSAFSQATPIVPDIPPSIAPVANQVTSAGQPVTVNFTLSDSQVDPANLTVAGHSSNTAVVPEGNLIFGGSGGARTVTLSPAPFQTGVTTVTLVASDGLLNYTCTFDLAVVPRRTGGFITTGSMSIGRVGHSATLLPSGKVLVAGGYYGSMLSTAELYDPSTGTFTATGSLIWGRWMHTATLLQNGEALITGGDGADDSAMRYDPPTGTFVFAGRMNSPRSQHTATLLTSGMVLIVGGTGYASLPVGTAELYDPATGAFTLTGSLTTARRDHTATLLNNGQVLVVGGVTSSDIESSAELYDPATRTFSPTGSMSVGHALHTATLLANGKVLVAGGAAPGTAITIAELYDPATGTFSATANMAHGRYRHTATLLPNGSVLVAGGGYYGSWLASTELYNPATGAFSQFNDMSTARGYHTATSLQNGAVLITGGYDSSANILASAELLWPNAAPVANAGPDQTVSVNSPCQASVTLNGSGSSDTDSDPLAYTWTGDFGTATGATPTVALAAGIHLITLTVDDRRGGTASATVTVTVNVVPATLVANAGADQTVSADYPCPASVTLSGSASGALDGEPLTYTWTGDFGTAIGPTPTLKLSAGTHVITLTVDDRGCASASATVTVTVTGRTSASPGGFAMTGSMSTSREGHSATLLPNGKVLVAGGFEGWLLGSADLYDPCTGAFTPTGNLNRPRVGHTATLLPDGEVLIAGGMVALTAPGDDSLMAELYDPTTATFIVTGTMSSPRANCTATLLPNGKVLVVGGSAPSGLWPWDITLASAELYDPATGLFTLTGSLITARSSHTATLLASGQVLITGGLDSSGNAQSSAELYDPATGRFSLTGGMSSQRAYHTATLLANGDVSVAGRDYSADSYDAQTGTFSFVAGTLNTWRVQHTATLLPDGSVLLTGGFCGGIGFLSSAERFDPISRTFFQSDTMAATRELHTATLLPNGAVLIAGGYNGSFLQSAELWEPSSPPVANAGPSQTVPADSSCTATVTLDGTGSSDPNGTPLVYLWTGDFGTTTGATPTITLSPGGHPINLTVANASGATASATVSITVTATPTITGLDPGAVNTAGSDFILTVNGCGFANGSTVYWNGAARPTMFVNSSQLAVAISAADIASTAEFYAATTVTVINPDGKVSNPATFTVWAPNVVAAQTVSIDPGQGGLYFSDNSEHGFTGFVNNQDTAPLAVTMAVYNQNPAPRPFPDLGTGYSALLFSGASIADSASVVFDFPADNLGFINPFTPGLTLLYFNGSFWAPVLSSGGLPPTIMVDTWEPWYQSQDQGLDGNASGNLTVVFDSTSTPKITDLNKAKYFAVGITPSLNLSFRNFSNGAVGLGSGATGSGGSAGVGNTFWFDNFQVGAPGVPPELIATLDYSDSFTLTPTRTDGLVYDGNSSGAFNVENTYGNLPAAWTLASGIFTFKTPASSTDPTALGAATGDPGAGFGLAESTDIDFNFAYGLRSDYVVQVDAILPSDRLDISSVPAAGDSPLWYIVQYAPGTVSVFFRRDSAVGGWAFPLAPRGVCGIGIYNGTWEIGLYDASGNPLLTGVNDNNWHNFAVEFDQDHNRLRIYVDRVLKATVDLATLALPTIACPADITATAGPGQTSSPVTFNVSARGNNATDTVVVCNPTSGSAFPIGTTTVNCTAMDAFGNQSSCSFQVTVNPAMPTIATLSPATATAGGTDLTLTVNGSNFADGSIVQWNGAARASTFVSPNQLTATISAADITLAGQNINTALITVQNPDGTISSPQAFTIVNPDVGTVQSQVATGGQTASASAPPTASDQGGVTASLDNTSGTQPVTVTAATYTSNPGTGTTFDVGSSYVDLKVSGAAANNSMTSYFYYPATVTGTAEANLLLLYYTPAGWAPVLSSGGVAPAKDTTDNLAGTTSGGRFTVVFDGTSTPQITQLTGTPFALAIDTTPPTITCPANINLPCSVNLLVPVSFTVTATDNCDPSPKVVCTPASGSGFPVGTTTVNCRATDFSGNTSTCSFTVTRAPLGFSGFLTPIGGADSTGGSFASPLRTFKMGSTVPVKLTASCGSSAVVTGVHTLQVIKSSNATTAGTPIDATPQGAATTGDQFRLSDGQWLFNLDTKATGMSTGIWLLRATLSDGSQHSACIQLK